MAQYNLNRNYALTSKSSASIHPCYWYDYSKNNTIIVSFDNLSLTKTNTSWDWIKATRGVLSGKWYWEVTVDYTNTSNQYMVGVTTYGNTSSNYVGSTSYGWGYYGNNGYKYHGGSNSSFGLTYTIGDTVGVALDMDNKKLFITDGDGNWQQSQDPVSGANPFADDILPYIKIYPSVDSYAAVNELTANFGASPFLYTMPVGYTSLHYRDLAVEEGNKHLFLSDIDLLIDGNTTSTGVALNTSDILFLETDLTDRLKVDGIRLYMSSPSSSGTVLDHIDFYYKNNESDSFSLAGKDIDIGGYYYATIPTPSAPRYVRTTVSGLDSTLYEYVIYNDDYLVGFGTEGNLHRKYLERATIGTQGTATTLPIFNNNDDLNDPSVDAYVCIDYSGNIGDYYLKLSSLEDGTYYSLDDGGIIEDDAITSNIKWSHGTFSFTEISGDSVILSPNAIDYILGNVPLVNTASYGWNCTSNCWEQDRVSGRVFCMGSDSGPQLKLWEYFVEDNRYEFMTILNPTGPTDHLRVSSMAYINDKAYVCMNTDGKFGYYDLSGVVNNWTDLADIPEVLTNVKDRIAIIGDNERYIYAACVDSLSGAIPAPYTTFHRYDTISGTTWEDLDRTIRGASTTTGWGVYLSLAYDRDNNCIYLLAMDYDQPASTASDYLQRYDIATDTWNNSFFRLADDFTTGQRHKTPIDYYDDFVYFYLGGLSGVCYRLNLSTFTLESYYFVAAGTSYERYILAIEPTGSSTSSLGPIILVANIASNNRKVGGYGLYNNAGTYTTPVFRVANSYMSSYFLVENTVNEYTNISWDSSIRNGTVMHRSSDTEPIPVIEYYWPYSVGNYIRVSKNVVYTEDNDDLFINIDGSNIWDWASLAVNPADGTVAVSMYYISGSTVQSQIRLYGRSGSLTHTDLNTTSWFRRFEKMRFDSEGGLWVRCEETETLIHFNSSLLTVASISVLSASFIDFTVAEGSDNVWYLTSSALFLLDYNGTDIFESVYVLSPIALCRAGEGYVWVVSLGNVVYKYDTNGIQVAALSLPRDATLITRDYEGGFWYSDKYFVAHMDSNGQQTFSLTMADEVDHIVGGLDCCIAFSSSAEKIFYIDKALQMVSKTFSPTATSWKDFNANPDLFSYDLDMFYENGLIEIPQIFDPIWDPNATFLEWDEIQLNGAFLPKHRFHQLDIKLQTTNTNYVPSIDKIVMAPAVKLSGIASQTSRDLYIKTDIPVGADVQNYETKLRTWWSVIDD